MDENGIGKIILGCALKVHRTLGPGLLENAYEACLAHEFEKVQLPFQRQLVLPVLYDGQKVELGYRLDLLVADKVVVEVKATEGVAGLHRAQVLSYLRLGQFRLGYVLNFNVSLMKDGVHRVVNGLR